MGKEVSVMTVMHNFMINIIAKKTIVWTAILLSCVCFFIMDGFEVIMAGEIEKNGVD